MPPPVGKADVAPQLSRRKLVDVHLRADVPTHYRFFAEAFVAVIEALDAHPKAESVVGRSPVGVADVEVEGRLGRMERGVVFFRFHVVDAIGELHPVAQDESLQRWVVQGEGLRKILLDEQVGPLLAVAARMQVFAVGSDFERQDAVAVERDALTCIAIGEAGRCVTRGLMRQVVSAPPLARLPDGPRSRRLEAQRIGVGLLETAAFVDGIGTEGRKGQPITKLRIAHPLPMSGRSCAGKGAAR